MVKAVIFDLDGLLVDSEPIWFEARKNFMNKFKYDWTEEDHKKQMGVSTEFWANYTYKKIKGKISQEEVVQEILNRMVKFYESGEVTILPGANEALNYCSSNYITGLASGSPLRLINAALKGAKWHKHFMKIVSSDEVKNGKPAPDTYLKIFKRLKIDACDAVVVEDSSGGITAGVNSGAKVIAVPNPELLPSKEALSKATIVLKTLHEIPKALKILNR